MAVDEKDPNEIGSLGLEAYSGFVTKAYHADLFWPGVYPLYNRLRRSDPEMAVTRQFFQTIGSGLKFKFETPPEVETPTDVDKRAVDFGNSVLADTNVDQFRDEMIAYTPFMGWGWWEIVPGVRDPDWTPPQDDDWRSLFSDGMIGVRRLAFRDHSSFMRWEMNERTGRVTGMEQYDQPNESVTIPKSKSVHLTFGDSNNPEGLTPLEAVWRLERIKYGLEVVQGIGYEHAAGHLSVKKTEAGELTASDHANIKRAARAILTAQEGNYAAWPFGFDASVVDVTFGAGPSILEAIRYYGLLKLALFNMQWIGMSTISDTGSYSALQDASAVYLLFFNAMMSGFTKQADKQLGGWLFRANAGAFNGLTYRPRLTVDKVNKIVNLEELGAFFQTIAPYMPTGEEDWKAVRKHISFLPETPPEDAQIRGSGEATDAPATGESTVGAENIQNKALNGAQVTSLMEIIFSFQRGELPKTSAVALIQAAFPDIGTDTVNSLLTPAEVVVTPDANPAGAANFQRREFTKLMAQFKGAMKRNG